jgi:hypothetical protein
MSVIKKIQLLFQVDNTEANEAIEETAQEVKQVETNMEDVAETGDIFTGGMISQFKGVVNSVKTAVASLRTLKGALIASGIGLFAIGLGSVTAAFTNSEEGQDRFNKLMLSFNVIVGNSIDILENLGKSILSAGKILGKIFTGQIGAAALEFDNLKESVGDTVEGIKDFGKETEKEIKQARLLSDLRAAADKDERKLIIDRAEADRVRADLLEKAVDRDRFSTQERIQFLKDASALEETITNQEIDLAQTRLDNLKLQNSFGQSKKEDLDAEAQLTAELITLETARLTKQKEVTSQILALKTEEKAANDAATAAAEAEIKAQEDALKSFEEKELEALAITEELKTELAVRKSDERYEALIKLARQYGKDTYELETAQILARQDILLAAGKDEVDLTENTQKTKHDVLLKFTAIGLALATEGSNAGKALAIANALISTYSGAAQVLDDKTLPLIAKIAGVATVLTTGFTQIRAIQQTQIPVLSVGGVSAAGGSPAPQIQAPSFNVVGASPINQLTEAIAGQQQQPVRAYVVANDVTTAQSVDRNAIQTSGI